MRILYLASGQQQNVSIICALGRMGHETGVYPAPIESIGGTWEDDEEGKKLRAFLKDSRVELVISNVFSPAVAHLTFELNIKYAVYGMDSPMYETYLPVFPRYDNCFLFFFDKREYRMAKGQGYANVYYLPLAADTAWTESLVITEEEIKNYRCDMSFVGGLYSDNLYDQYIGRFPEGLQQIFTEMMEKSAFQWDGMDRLGMLLTPELAAVVKKVCPELYTRPYELPDPYYLKEYFFARKLTHIERTLLMEILAERYDLHLYTRNDEAVPEGIRRHPQVSQMSGGFKVFYSSRINLNITMRSIESGIPMRIFDIMSVGGFVLSNYQEEIPELFEEGQEIATFRTPEELIEKADYYLKHDKERMKIGINGYQKVKKCYTYEQQLNKILSILFPSP
ncbi:MAG: glycosyltransferase [Blautia sp.]|nr:glycosyltransferase [Blautia sp.]MCM1200187.1 glycosyltransferase [Bacteroides fragilis]